MIVFITYEKKHVMSVYMHNTQIEQNHLKYEKPNNRNVCFNYDFVIIMSTRKINFHSVNRTIR